MSDEAAVGRGALAQALLRAALTDVTSPDVATQAAARRWLLDDEVCVACCRVLGLEVETVRAGVRERLDGAGPAWAARQ